jgi:hypothetical protein
MKNKEIKINDFYQAVILMTTGFQLLRLEHGDSKFSVFVFVDPNNNAQETISDYWSHKVKVDARKLIENINELKSRLYSKI